MFWVLTWNWEAVGMQKIMWMFRWPISVLENDSAHVMYQNRNECKHCVLLCRLRSEAKQIFLGTIWGEYQRASLNLEIQSYKMKWCIIYELRTGFSQFYKTSLKRVHWNPYISMPEGWKVQYQHSNPTTDSRQLFIPFHLWTLVEVPLTDVNFTIISQLKLVEKIITVQTWREGWGGIIILMCLLSGAVPMNHRQVHLVPRWGMCGATPAVPHTPSWPGAYLRTQTTYICEKQKVNNFRTPKLKLQSQSLFHSCRYYACTKMSVWFCEMVYI